MKIQEFINHNKDLHINDDLKHSIYQKVLSKTVKIEKKGYSRFFYTKMFMGVFLVFVLGALLYGNNVLVENIENGKVIKNKSVNTVYADSIAKIISFDGSYNIYHNDEISQTQNISEGDIVVLDTGSKLTFDINSENYGEVYGPATFSIRKEGSNKYFIDLKQSEYFKFYKKVNESGGVLEKLFATSTETVISTNKYQIKGKNLNVIIAKKSQDESFIKNNGDSLTIVDGENEINVPNNKIAKLDKNINVIGSSDDKDLDQNIINKLNNPDIILLAYDEEQKTTTKLIADLVDQNKIEDYKTKLQNGKILVKKLPLADAKASGDKANLSGGENSGSIISNLLDEKYILAVNPILNYKNIQSRFDTISNKMSSYDRMYLEDIYSIGESLAVVHTKLGLAVNYYPNIYYIKYMSDNLKNYFSKFDNIPNDYIYSLSYISKMMDQLNEKKAGDSLTNDYSIVPEIIKNDQKVIVSTEVNSQTGSATGVNSSGVILTGNQGTGTTSSSKDSLLQFKKQMHGSASGEEDPIE